MRPLQGAATAGSGAASWASISTRARLAELSARADDDDARPACGSSQRGAYDTPVHVGALILILVLSTLFCAVPLFSNRTKGRKQGIVVFLCQHFGTGVLLATAFVHLLPTAFVSLTNPCLPRFFSKRYTPLAGLIAMIAVLAVIALESYLTTRGAGHTHSHELWGDGDLTGEEDSNRITNKLLASTEGLAARRGTTHWPRHIPLEDLEASEGLVAGVSPLPESTPTTAGLPREVGQNGVYKPGGTENEMTADRVKEDDDLDSEMDLELDLNELDPVALDDENTANRRPPSGRYARVPPTMSRGRGFSTTSTTAAPLTPEQQQRLLLQCLLLEAGILFHSVFIGMALSVATGPPFALFLVAIALHQSFEGLALGSRIAAIQLPRSSFRPWLMVLAFGCTTPLGQAVGLIVHNFYDPMGKTGLLMVGFMNAISAGLLLFAGLVQLLAEDFLSDKSYRALHGRRRAQAYLAVLGGAGLMAAVGALA